MTIITDRSRDLSRRSSALGFTLTELLVAIAVGGLFLMVATAGLNMLARSSLSVGNYADMNATSRRALEAFATDVRMAVDVVTSSDDDLQFWAYDDSLTLVQVRYWYDSSDDTLYRNYDGDVSTVLTDVQVFDFEYYDLTQSTTSSPLSVKEVEINASLNKWVLALRNTNEIISARFMMRNRQVSS